MGITEESTMRLHRAHQPALTVRRSSPCLLSVRPLSLLARVEDENTGSS